MSEEAQVFRGDRPVEESEVGQSIPPIAKARPDTLLAKNDLPAGEPVGDVTAEHAEPAPPAEAAVAPAPAPTEPEPEYNFEIDPDSLWSMPAAMHERLSNLASASAITHQILDDQERETARIAKALRA